MKRKVSIYELKVGYELEADIKGENGRTLIAKGVVLNQGQVDRLKRWFAKSDYMFTIEDGQPEVVDAKKSKKQKIENLQKETLESLEAVYRSYGPDLDKALAALNPSLNHLCDDLKSIEDIPADVIRIVYANKPGSHYFRLTRMAIALASIYNKDKSLDTQIPLKSICLAALLHDFGERYKNDPKGIENLNINSQNLEGINISPSSLGKTYNGSLHSIYSYIALKDRIPKDVRKMILYCNYNDSKTETNLRPEVKAAKIITLCDIYDSLLEQAINQDLYEPFENVISYMSQLAFNGQLDNDLFKMFLNHMPIYPTGTKVVLSNDQIAVVLNEVDGYPTRPNVIVIDGIGTKTINLSEQTSITIRRVLSESKSTQTKINDIQNAQIQNSSATAKESESTSNDDEQVTIELQLKGSNKPKTLNKKLKSFFDR